jgi:acyl carrier protein
MRTIHGIITEALIDMLFVDEEEVTSNARLVEDLGCDSLDMLELALDCENRFDLDIPDEDWAKIITVGDVISYLETKTAPTTVQI